MEQYLDKKDNKWHITFWFNMPRVIIKNKLNFRIKEVVLDDGSIINDPNLNDSSYIFSIPESMLGKNIFFNFSFSQEEISKISEFRIGLCDEKVRWFNNDISIKNNFIEKTIQNIELKENNVANDLNIQHENIMLDEVTSKSCDNNLKTYDLKNEIIDNVIITKNSNKKKYKKSK